MAADNFWNNREKAQTLIDEANSLRNKIEPLLQAEKQLDDFRVMLELGEGEPPEAQAQVEQELTRDLAKFLKELDALELKVFLSGPHDRKNCILSINAGAGGTEAQDGRKCCRACISAGPNRAAGRSKSLTRCPVKARGLKASRCCWRAKRLRLCQGRTRCAPAGAHLAVRFQ